MGPMGPDKFRRITRLYCISIHSTIDIPIRTLTGPYGVPTGPLEPPRDPTTAGGTQELSLFGQPATPIGAAVTFVL